MKRFWRNNGLSIVMLGMFFVAIGCMVVFSIYLRQRGSPESKPVDAPHSETGA